MISLYITDYRLGKPLDTYLQSYYYEQTIGTNNWCTTRIVIQVLNFIDILHKIISD